MRGEGACSMPRALNAPPRDEGLVDRKLLQWHSTAKHARNSRVASPLTSMQSLLLAGQDIHVQARVDHWNAQGRLNFLQARYRCILLRASVANELSSLEVSWSCVS